MAGIIKKTCNCGHSQNNNVQKNVKFEDEVKYQKQDPTQTDYPESSAGRAVKSLVMLFTVLQKICRYFLLKSDNVKDLDEYYREFAYKFPILDCVLAVYIGIIGIVLKFVPFRLLSIMDAILCFIWDRIEISLDYIEELKRIEKQKTEGGGIPQRPRHKHTIKRSLNFESMTTEPLGLP